MKYLVQNRKNLLLATLMAASFGLNAQIESTHTDVKYGYTTVVYKDKAASDTDVLSALDNSIGIGDVIRVTVAPPKPAVVPNVDKSKGEDTWLKPVGKPTASAMTATVATVPVKNILINRAAPRPAAAPAAAMNAAPVAPKAMVKKVAATPSQVVAVQAENVAVANVEATNAVQNSFAAPAVVRVTRSAESINAAKSANKSLKKSKGNFKPKSRKKGKQRYKCPKF